MLRRVGDLFCGAGWLALGLLLPACCLDTDTCRGSDGRVSRQAAIHDVALLPRVVPEFDLVAGEAGQPDHRLIAYDLEALPRCQAWLLVGFFRWLEDVDAHEIGTDSGNLRCLESDRYLGMGEGVSDGPH